MTGPVSPKDENHERYFQVSIPPGEEALSVFQVDVNRVKTGIDLRIIFDAILNQEYNGKVVEVAPVGPRYRAS